MNETAPGDEDLTGKLFDMAAYRAGRGPDIDVESLPTDEEKGLLPEPMPEADHAQLLVNWQIARNEFARIGAGRSSRTFHFGRSKEFSEEALEAAKNAYELHRSSLMGHQAVMAFAAGARDEELEKQKAEIADDHASSLAEALFREREISTTLFARANDIKGVPILEYHDKTPLSERQYSKNKLGHSIRRAYWWWGRQNDGTVQGKINRAGATVALGLPFGVAGVALAPLAAGAIGIAGASAAVAAMTRVSKSAMVFHLDKRGSANRQISGLNSEINKAIERGEAESVANLVVNQTKENVKDNRKLAGLAAISVLGGIALGEMVHLLSPGIGHIRAQPHGYANAQPARGVTHHTASPHTRGMQPSPTHHLSRHPENTLSPRSVKKEIYINPKNIGKSYVSSVYEKAEGLHEGFKNMLYAAHTAITRGDLVKVQSSPGNFWYEVTNKGAREFAKGAAGSDKSVNVMRVLSHFGRVSILHR